MTLTADAVCDHLIALRADLYENRWMHRVDKPVLAIFNELLTAANRLAPNEVVRSIEAPENMVKPGTLLTIVDQLVVALGTATRSASVPSPGSPWET